MNKITEIETQKKNKERVNVYINGEYAFACDSEFVFRKKLKVGMQIDLVEIKQILTEDEFKKCRNTALRIIERNYKTEKEVHNKLIEKGYTDEAIEGAINFLKDYKYIDDEKYASMFVRDKIKTQGRNKIRYALIRKGINDEIIKNVLNDNSDNDAELDVALSIAKRRYDTLVKRENDKYKLSQKLYRFLVGKGYTFDIASKVIKKIIDNDYEESYYEG